MGRAAVRAFARDELFRDVPERAPVLRERVVFLEVLPVDRDDDEERDEVFADDRGGEDARVAMLLRLAAVADFTAEARRHRADSADEVV